MGSIYIYDESGYQVGEVDDAQQSLDLGDVVHHPSHYTQGGIECLDAIRAALTDEEFRGYCKGNVLKYIWRERHKGGDESLKKAGVYLDRALEESASG